MLLPVVSCCFVLFRVVWCCFGRGCHAGEDASPPPAPKRSLPSGGDGMEKLQRLSCPKRPRLV